MKIRLLMLGIISTLLIYSCHKDDSPKDWSEEVNLLIAHKYVDYYPFGVTENPVKGINTKEEKSNKWTTIHEKGINGFDYEEGYEYSLKVLKIHLGAPPQDDFDFRYEVISIISKTKK